MRKFLLSIFLVTALLLTACGDSKSDKEAVVDAFDSILEADSYESSTSIDLELDADFNDPTVEPFIQMVNDIELKADSVYDAEQALQEAVFYFSGTLSPMTFTVEVPFLQDLQNNVMYIETDSIIDNFGLFLGLPEDLKGYLVEIDLEEIEDADAPSTEELNAHTQEIISELLNEKSDDDFSRDGDVYTVVFTEDDIKNLIEKSFELVDDTVPADELQFALEGLDEVFNELDINALEMQLTIDNGELKEQNFVIDVLVEEGDEYLGIALTINTAYKNMNGDVEFTINPDDYDILNMEELEQLIFELMYYGY